MVSTTNWTLTDLYHTFLGETIHVHAITDVPCHLELCVTSREPDEHKHRTQKRGMDWYVDIKYCFVEYTCFDQVEAGDTLVHNWKIAGWVVCRPEWFIMRGTIGGNASVSNTPIFKRHRQEGELPMLVINLGKFGEAEVLVGEVKLEEGSGITITRKDANNSLQIAVTAAALLDPWTLNIYQPSLESLDAYDLGGIAGSGQVILNPDNLMLTTGSTDGSVAAIAIGRLGWAYLRHARASRVRFITTLYQRSGDVERWWTLGKPEIGHSAYGFYSNGFTLRLYARNPAGSGTLFTGVNLNDNQEYRLEAEYTPGVGVQGYVDGVDVGLLATDLPTTDGFGLSARLEVASTNGARLYVKRWMADHRLWTP